MRTPIAIGLCAGLSVVFACALVVPRPEPERATPRPEIPPEERTPPQDEACIDRPPPRRPSIDVNALNCPARFGACLSPEDSAKDAAWKVAIESWAREADRRCRGR